MLKMYLQLFGGRGASSGINASGGNAVKSFAERIQNKREANKKNGTFDESLFKKLPKGLQDDKVIAIGKEKTYEGNRYSAVIEWEDGFQRSISEYTLADFKNYISDVLKKDRKIEY